MPSLLFVGDLHLGRRPSRLPPDLEGLRPADLGPAAAWRAAVDWALRARVDAVVLAGDVVESDEDRFEAFGHLQAGVARLVEAGIAVIGVAGNHDVRALPRLASRVPGFHLLGARGTWAHVDVTGADGRRVRLVGWSFPDARFRGDPLEGLEVPVEAGLPILGVLHADLDGAPGSPYAPVRRADLAARPVDGWLLGHVHRPDALSGPRPLGYLGSLVGLDPGEPGAHGPWRLDVAGPGEVRAAQIPLAPLRYERVTVDLGALPHAEDDVPAERLEAAVHGALAEAADRCEAADDGARLVACRVVLTGRSPHHAALVRASRSAMDALRHHRGDRTVVVEQIVDEAAAALDLVALARGTTPPALLARRILALEAGGPEAEALVRAAAPRLGRAASDRVFADLGAPPPDDEAVRRLLIRAGREALEGLVEQGRAS